MRATMIDMETSMQRHKIRAALIVSLPFAAAAEQMTEVSGYKISYAENGFHVAEVISPVREVTGTPEQITIKAQACAARTLSNSGVAAPSILEGLAGGFRPAEKEATPLIELVDKESGLLVANSVAPYTSGMLSNTARAKVTVQAKDGRFRIVQSDLAKTISSGDSSYHPIVTSWGSGGEPALKALIGKTEKLAECIVAPSGASEDW
jgi:hypothetical protein